MSSSYSSLDWVLSHWAHSLCLDSFLFFFALSCPTAYTLYYCNTVGWTWWDWSLILRTLLQCFDAVGWVIWSVKTCPRYDQCLVVRWTLINQSSVASRWMSPHVMEKEHSACKRNLVLAVSVDVISLWMKHRDVIMSIGVAVLAVTCKLLYSFVRNVTILLYFLAVYWRCAVTYYVAFVY